MASLRIVLRKLLLWLPAVVAIKGNDPDEKLARLEGASGGATLIILAGIFLEIGAIWFRLPWWSDRVWTTVADGLIGGGLVIEYVVIRLTIVASSESKAASDLRVAKANERAANADLARVELESKLRPRELNQDQWDLVQTFRGKFDHINVAFETDAETRWFAYSVMMAFMSVGIKAAFIPRAPEVQSFGTLIYDPKGFDGARPRTVEPLIELFRKSDTLPSLAVVTGVPTDIAESAGRLPYDAISSLPHTPMVIIGGRFTVPPAYWPKTKSPAPREPSI